MSLGKVLIFVFGLSFFVSASQSDVTSRLVLPKIHSGIKFTENQGQWEKNILYKASLDGGALFVETNKLHFNFYDKKALRLNHHGKTSMEGNSYKNLKGHAYQVEFVGCRENAVKEALQEGSDYENFYLGTDPLKWKEGVKNYRQLWLKGLYEKIDYELFAAVNGVKYNFHVRPGGQPGEIQLKYQGVKNLRLHKGNLILKLEVNEVIEQKPYAYQVINGEVKEVDCEYVLKDFVLSFLLPKGYDPNYTLIIDPILVFSAQIGVVTDNFGMTATYDQQGNLYSGGITFDVGYATTLGAYDLSYNNPNGDGRTDVFITKYNSTGNSLLYSTYLGGSGTEVVSSLVVDGNNNLCLYGATSSTNFPITTGAAFSTFMGGSTIGFFSNGVIFCGGSDMYVSKFNSSGSSLLASTYYGGSGNDGINYLSSTFNVTLLAPNNPCIATFPTTNYDSLQTNYGDQFRGEIQVDALNNIYIVSSTRSNNIPIVGGFDNTLNGAQDAILAKFNPALTSLIYSSYYGGSQNDCGNGIYISSGFEVYVTGGTCSSNLQGTSNGHQSLYQGGKSDGFLCMVNAAGNAIVNATYIGTNDYDNSFFVSADNNGKIFVYGQSYGNMPIQPAPTTSTVFNVPGTHQFVSAYTRTLNALYMSTVFGSKQVGVDISPSAFKVDTCNKIVLSGWGGGIITNTAALSNMPILKPLPNHSTTTGYDFYLMALDTNAKALLFGSYFGGNQSGEHVDGGTSRFDPSGKIYQSVCAGCGGADDFPLSPGAWPCPNNPNCINQNPSGNCNNGVFKVDFELERMSALSSSTMSGCNPVTVSFSNSANPLSSTATYTWNFGNGQTNSSNPNPSVTYTAPGTYSVSLYVYDPNACITKDSSYTFVQVIPSPVLAFSTISTACSNTVQIANTSSTNPVVNSFLWNFGDGSAGVNANAPAHSYTASGIYNIQVTGLGANGCSSSQSQTVSILYFQPGIGPGSDICDGKSAVLNAFGGNSYTWAPASSLSSSSTASTIASPTANTVYTVNIVNASFGLSCQETRTLQVLVRPSPTTAFTYTANVCGGGINFFDQSQSDIVAWYWTLASNATSTLQNPYYFYSQGGTYTVSLTSTNSYSCQSTRNLTIQVSPPPPVAVNGATQICIGNKAQLYAFGGISYSWSPAASLDFPASSSPIASPSVSTLYSVVITTTGSVNGESCKFLLTQSVSVSVLSSIPVSAYANPGLIKKGDNSTLIYTGSPGALVQWYPLNSTSPAFGYTVTAKPDSPKTYTAVATNGACREDITVFVDVYNPACLDKDLFIPNTFTPNNDGNNDNLFVRGLKVEEFYFAVYNRWGEKVFETRDRSVGWDGIYKGKPADVGVFGWYLEAKCQGGEEAFLKGNVTLIR